MTSGNEDEQVARPPGHVAVREPKRFDVRGTLVRVPEVVALRRKVANICNDEDCALSGGDAHAGPCEPCGCGLEHAALECHVATVAGWIR